MSSDMGRALLAGASHAPMACGFVICRSLICIPDFSFHVCGAVVSGFGSRLRYRFVRYVAAGVGCGVRCACDVPSVTRAVNRGGSPRSTVTLVQWCSRAGVAVGFRPVFYYLRLVEDEQWCQLGVNVLYFQNDTVQIQIACRVAPCMGALHMGMNDVTQLYVRQICQH